MNALEGSPLPVYGDGRQVRDWLYVEDHCRATRFTSFARSLMRPSRRISDRLGHDRRYAMCNRKIESELGFKPVETFQRGMRKTLLWYLEHEEWWRGVMNGSYRDWTRRHYGANVSF